MAKNKDGGGGGGEEAVGGGSGGQQPITRLARPGRPASSGSGLRERHTGAGRERERLGRPGREAYPHLIQLTGAIWQLLAR